MKRACQVKINIPVDVKAWLSCQAERNLRSLTAEVVLAIREKMETQKEKADAQA